jgi:hypothetical protein
MQEVRFDRLSMVLQGLIFVCMEKALYIAPTTEELYALEKRARRARALYVAAALKSLYERAVSALSSKVVSHA